MRRVVVSLSVAVACVAAPGVSSVRAAPTLRSLVVARLQHPRRLSSGMRMWLYPSAGAAAAQPAIAANPAFGSNVDAASPQEDVAAGQSESAIAAAADGSVMVDWNDVSGFFFSPATRLRASATGVGFSRDGGHHFRDLIGFRNTNPDQQWSGDPSVVAIDGGRHFIVSSLYVPSPSACFADSNPAYVTVGIEIATPTAHGVTFGNPVIAARPGNICKLFTNNPPNGIGILDKDWLSWNQATRTLDISYARYFLTGPQGGNGGQIEVIRKHVPLNPTAASLAASSPAIVVSPGGFDDQNGAYTAQSPGGATYVAWEQNVGSNLFDGDPYVRERVAYVPAGAQAPAVGGPGHPVVVTTGQTGSVEQGGGVASLDASCIAGYNRCPILTGTSSEDFPRIAYDAPRSRVVVEWNDASHHPLGDIWMRGFTPGLAAEGRIVRVNDDADYTLHMFPAVSVRSDGSICSSWYDRRRFGPDSASTDLYGECRSTPTAAGADFRITTGATDWANTSTLIIPNFGDYTDQTSVGGTTYYTWADGRLGIPQPFAASR